MPLTENQIKFITSTFGVAPDSTENLSKALRRACGMPPKALKTEDWGKYIELVKAMIEALKEMEKGSEALTGLNSQQKNVLHYAIDSALQYAKDGSDQEQLNYRLMLVSVVCNVLPSSELNVEAYLEEKHTKEYVNNPDQLFIDGIKKRGFDKLPRVDTCIKALEFIIESMRNALEVREKKVALEDCSSIVPVVILTSHIDSGIETLFKEYLSTLVANKYAVVCHELPAKFDPEAYLKVDSSTIAFKGLEFKSNPMQKRAIEIHQSVISAAKQEHAHLHFVDCTPASAMHMTIFNDYLITEYALLEILASTRDEAMANAAIVSASEHDSNPILICGISHYYGVKAKLDEHKVKAKYMLATDNAEEFLTVGFSQSQTEAFQTELADMIE